MEIFHQTVVTVHHEKCTGIARHRYETQRPRHCERDEEEGETDYEENIKLYKKEDVLNFIGHPQQLCVVC